MYAAPQKKGVSCYEHVLEAGLSVQRRAVQEQYLLRVCYVPHTETGLSTVQISFPERTLRLGLELIRQRVF